MALRRAQRISSIWGTRAVTCRQESLTQRRHQLSSLSSAPALPSREHTSDSSRRGITCRCVGTEAGDDEAGARHIESGLS